MRRLKMKIKSDFNTVVFAGGFLQDFRVQRGHYY